MSAGYLGCGQLSAWITDCGGTNAQQLDPTVITWERTEDSTPSVASIMLAVERTTSGTICSTPATRAVPWQAELEIYRDGALVHAGPITTRRERRNAVAITSVDLLGWTTRRLAGLRTGGGAVDADRVMGAVDATDLAVTVVLDALNGCNTAIRPTQMSDGRTASITARSKDLRPVDETLRDTLAATVDMTMVGRELRVWSQDSQTIVATLTDRHFLIDAETTEDGATYADIVYVRGADGLTGRYPLAQPETVCCAVEVVVDRSDLKTQAAVDAAAAAEWAKRRGGMTLGANLTAQLTPDAPVTIEDLVPGNKVQVIMLDRIWPIDQTMVISRVEGRAGTGSIDGAARGAGGQFASTGSGTETISVTLRPYGGA